MAEESNEHWVQLSREPLEVAAAYQFLRDPTAGGIAVFVGTTRQWTDGQETRFLVYESYEFMALKEMHRILDVALKRWPIKRACLLHRLGTVPFAEASVLIGVSTPHRSEAFEACRFLIDRLKVQVPIWKQECFSDGRVVWVQGSELPEVPTP